MDLPFNDGKTLCNKKQKANEVQQTFFVLEIHILLSLAHSVFWDVDVVLWEPQI